ncbi:hypothetical protein cypCar_00004768 [Cyprinus carpio]|nr:hypothetical protein cypCar_00004768 [Cyprinus carpio]
MILSLSVITSGLSTIELVCCFALALVIVFCVVVYCHHRRSTQAAIQGDFIETDEMTLMSAMVGETVTLHDNVTEIQEDELIRWKFAKSRECNQAEFYAIAKWNKTNNEENLYNEERFGDRLHLHHNTGSLTITNITPEHYRTL